MSRSLLAFASFVASVAAHGHVTGVVVNGVLYPGWDIGSFPYMEDPPVVAAWGTPNTGNGPVDLTTQGYSNTDIICSLNATNAKGSIPVAAGDKLNLQWTEWPDTHHGPVVDYLASCGDSCETIDKTALEFFRIDGVGLVDGAEVPGTWGDDQLIKNNNSWMVQIPESIAPGNYVLRHELIALHGAGTEGGAQNYPQCFSLQVTGSGTDKPAGVVGTKLYTEDDAGILVNIYSSLSSYKIPGPTLYSGASSITQATSTVTSTGSAVAAGGGGGSASATGSASPTTTAAATTTPAASAKAAKAASSSPSTSASAPGSSTTLIPAPSTTSVAAPTSTPPSPSSSGSAGGSAGVYAQCGGSNWTGTTSCPSGTTCKKFNPYYSQCVPA
ncbi:hypothetical protein ASPVEDRAFT_45957 [Aspergillus versicolor CBS 583.65]|uniref:AA9 family lytic polysaccharide monooxygenase n=1 Tax=Aspergillus versicolor CBS 583.65 TaxID=1036611 RepID=A0A1L9PYH1_ASPVE|nr:uncharacterized protein ASPVEDRAFT_45957 [Aspergillus versicolor CBS 583.65]OJJ06600.1 hypothetical protein ASPVEDRAFT_45957 [Aspergillus versicolor CBS 583.65]